MFVLESGLLLGQLSLHRLYGELCNLVLQQQPYSLTSYMFLQVESSQDIE